MASADGDRTLMNYLHGLPPTAAKIAIRHLGGSIASVRLVNRSLRNFIDSNVWKGTIKLSPKDVDRWTAGLLPTIDRFANLTAVSLSIFLRQGGDDRSVSFLTIASLPFSGLSVATRQRITKLAFNLVPHRDVGIPPHHAEDAVTRLAHLLPNLRSLDLGGLCDPRWMSYDLAEQQIMFHALAALPHLEDLSLTSWRALKCVTTLIPSTTLRRLHVHGRYADDDSPTREAVSLVSQLRHLTHLSFEGLYTLTDGGAGAGAGPDHVLRGILDCAVPPSLERLELGVVRDEEGDDEEDNNEQHVRGRLIAETIHLQLSDGKISSICVDTDPTNQLDVTLSALAAAARQLMGCRQMPALPGRVRQLRVVADLTFPADRLIEPREWDGAEFRSLWDLVSRCEQVAIKKATVLRDGDDFTRSIGNAIGALSRLGKPLEVYMEGVRLTLRTAGQSAVWKAAGTETETGDNEWGAGPQQEAQLAGQRQRQDEGGGAQASAAVPSLDEALGMVMRGLTGPSAASVAAGVSAAGPTRAQAQASARTCETPQAAAADARRAAAERYASHLLILRGDSVGVLRGDTDRLLSCIEWLDRRAAAALDGEQSPQHKKQYPAWTEKKCKEDGGEVINSYFVLPAASNALMIECRDSRGLAGVEAVAAEARSAVEGRQAGALQVLRVAPEAVATCVGARRMRYSPHATYLGVVNQVLQGIWDQAVASGREGGPDPAGGELGLLQRLLELGVQLAYGVLTQAL